MLAPVPRPRHPKKVQYRRSCWPMHLRKVHVQTSVHYMMHEQYTPIYTRNVKSKISCYFWRYYHKEGQRGSRWIFPVCARVPCENEFPDMVPFIYYARTARVNTAVVLLFRICMNSDAMSEAKVPSFFHWKGGVDKYQFYSRVIGCDQEGSVPCTGCLDPSWTQAPAVPEFGILDRKTRILGRMPM